MEELRDVEELEVPTPFGQPSDRLIRGSLDGTTVIFGPPWAQPQLSAFEVPYRANIWAMRSLGVRGSSPVQRLAHCKSNTGPGPGDPRSIHRSNPRAPASFFGEGAVAHVAFAEPFCATLSGLLGDAVQVVLPEGRRFAPRWHLPLHAGPGVLHQGRIELYRSWGCDAIGMTNHTEARLAREAEIAYSTLAMVTDYDCWHPDHDAVTVEMVINNLRANATTAQQVVRHAAQAIQQQKPSSPAHSALQNGLLTAPEAVPAATRQKLDLFTRPYWGAAS